MMGLGRARLISPLNVMILLSLLVVPLGLDIIGKPFWLDVFTRLVLLAITASSLSLLLSVGGLASFGHAVYPGIGAYLMGIASYHSVYGGADWIAGSSLWWHMLLGVGASAVFAFISGAISLRTRGVHFIMITMAFSQMIYYLLISLEGYGGDDGLSIDLASELNYLDLENPTSLYLLCLASLTAVLILIDRLTRSRFGHVLVAASQNETRTHALGVNPFSYRLLIFVIAGAIGGYAGVLTANFSLFISPGMIEWTRSGELLFMVILGGASVLFGPVIGAAAFVLLELGLSRLTVYWHLPFGMLLLIVVLFGKGGIAQWLQRSRTE